MVHRGAIQILAIAAAAAALACASGSASRGSPAPRPAPAAGTAEPAPPAPSVETGGLTFLVEPGDAEVIIDGRSYGKVADLSRNGMLPLQPGLYQVSLKHPGYATWRAEVAVRGGIETIRVTLARRPAKP
jgi:hypothetical protein